MQPIDTVQSVKDALEERKRVKPLLNIAIKSQADNLIEFIISEIEINKFVHESLFQYIINNGNKSIIVATYNPIHGFIMPSIGFKQSYHEIIQYLHKHADNYTTKIKQGPFRKWILCVNSLELINNLTLSIVLDRPGECCVI